MKKLGPLVVIGALLAASSSFAFADSIPLGSFVTGSTAASLGLHVSQIFMADDDDTARVAGDRATIIQFGDLMSEATIVNLISGAAFGDLMSDLRCSHKKVSCEISEMASLHSPKSLDDDDVKVVNFIEPADADRDPYGGDLPAHVASVTPVGSVTPADPASAPEPSTLLLLGTGLVGAAGLVFRTQKRQTE